MATQVPPSQVPTRAEDLPPPPSKSLETPANYKDTFRGRSAASKFADPCEAASKASLDCLERTLYNRDEVRRDKRVVALSAERRQCADVEPCCVLRRRVFSSARPTLRRIGNARRNG